eukprot:SAG31_NODE_467_length_15267_cov_13.792919_10_plen_62_part_00
MLVDTLWATVAMMSVVSMRGSIAPAVAIAVYQQLEELNTVVAWFFSTVDSVADKMPVRSCC